MKAKKITAVLMASAIAISGAALTGCQQISQVIGQGKIGETITSSRHTEKKDREQYVEVQDIDGNPYVSVAYFEQQGTTRFDLDAFKEILAKHNVNWYQLIVSSAMGTSERETCYVYFPSDMSFTQLQETVAACCEGYDGHLLSKPEYDEYLANVKDIDLYHNESTYFGPAAGK